MTDADRLAEVAAQLAGRVRDEPAEANACWLGAMLPDPSDWFRLAFVLAAAVPDDQSWTELTDWTRARIGLRPHGTAAAVKRHEYHAEQLCPPCRVFERTRKATAREQRKAAA